MALKDWLNRLVRPKELETLAAEGGTTGVRQSFAEGVAPGLTPAGLAAILRDCDNGDIEAFMTLAEEMEERDPHYASVLGQRKRAVSGVKPIVEPASEDPSDVKIAEFVQEKIVDNVAYSSLVEDLLDAVGKGFSVVEIEWQRDKTQWWPGQFIWRTQRFFQFDKETGRELRLRDDADYMHGVELPPFKFIYHRAKLKSGHVFRGGIARVVAFSWMCKSYTVKDWMAFIETYGLPIRLGRYGSEHSKDDVATLFRAVANIGVDAAAVLPRGMEIEFVETKDKGGGSPVFENLARWVDEQVSKAVLGQTMTSDNGSSMAQANVHNEVRHDIAAADAGSVAETLNRDLVRPLVDLNFGPQKAYPAVIITIEEPEDLAITIEAIERLANAGVKFSAPEARRKVKMSDPKDDEETFGGVVQQTAENRVRRTEVATNRAEDGDADLLDEIEQAALADWEPTMTEYLQPAIEAIENATSYDDALIRLNEIPGLPKSSLVETLVKAAFKARSIGDVQDSSS